MGAVKGIAAVTAATVVATATMLFAMMGDGGSGGVAMAASDCGKPPGEGSSMPNQTYGSNEPSGEAVADIPDDYLGFYRAAGEDYGLDWTYLAAIGKIETDHGRYGADGGGCNTGPDTPYGNAMGPMQFIPSTWDMVGVDGDGDGTADPCNPADAIPAAANYLKQSGAPGDWYGAIYAYNHADWYVQDVMAQADAYRSADPGAAGSDQAAAPWKVDEGSIAAAALDALPPAHLGSLADTLRGKLGTQRAAAETLDWNLLNGDKTLTYADHTSYDSALQAGVGAWNGVGIISIEPSSGSVDVEIGDTTIQESILGRTSSDGTLVFNVPHMDDATQNAQNSTASHELGHAMGLAHTSNPSVMNTPIMSDQSDNHEVPTDFDVQELSGLWGSASPDDGGSSGDEQYDGGGAPEGPPSPGDGGPSGGGEDFDEEKFFGGLFGNEVPDGGGSQEETPNDFDPSGGDDGNIQINRNVQRDGDSPGGDATGGTSSDETKERMEDEGWPFNIFGGDDGDGEGGDPSGVGDPSGGGEGGKGGPEGSEERQYDGGGPGAGPGGGGGEPIACPDPGPGEGGDPPPDSPSGGGVPAGDGQAVVAEAERYLGVPYLLGGPEVCVPFETMDCTCLTTTVYRKWGYELTDSPAGQMGYGEPVQGELEPGDITFYAEHGDGIISHVGISMGGSKIIHASAYLGETGYTEDHGYLQGYVGARRLLN